MAGTPYVTVRWRDKDGALKEKTLTGNGPWGIARGYVEIEFHRMPSEEVALALAPCLVPGGRYRLPGGDWATGFLAAECCMADQTWGRPFRWEKLRNYPTPSCIDCEHIELAEMFSRRCAKHPGLHLWSPGYTPDQERQENGAVQAEECPDFLLSKDIREAS